MERPLRMERVYILRSNRFLLSITRIILCFFRADDLNHNNLTHPRDEKLQTGLKSSVTWGAEHCDSASLELWRQTLHLLKTPTSRSPRRKDVGCSVDGAISTKCVLNNPLPQPGKGEQVKREKYLFLKQGWNPGCWYIHVFLFLQLFFHQDQKKPA